MIDKIESSGENESRDRDMDGEHPSAPDFRSLERCGVNNCVARLNAERIPFSSTVGLTYASGAFTAT